MNKSAIAKHKWWILGALIIVNEIRGVIVVMGILSQTSIFPTISLP